MCDCAVEFRKDNNVPKKHLHHFSVCVFSFCSCSLSKADFTSKPQIECSPPSRPPPLCPSLSFFFFSFPASRVRTLHPQMPKIPLCFIWLEDRDEVRREGDQGGRVLAFWEAPAQPDKFQTRRWELIKRGGGVNCFGMTRVFKAGPVHSVKWRLLKTDDSKFCPPVL